MPRGGAWPAACPLCERRDRRRERVGDNVRVQRSATLTSPSVLVYTRPSCRPITSARDCGSLRDAVACNQIGYI